MEAVVQAAMRRMMNRTTHLDSGQHSIHCLLLGHPSICNEPSCRRLLRRNGNIELLVVDDGSLHRSAGFTPPRPTPPRAGKETCRPVRPRERVGRVENEWRANIAATALRRRARRLESIVVGPAARPGGRPAAALLLYGRDPVPSKITYSCI